MVKASLFAAWNQCLLVKIHQNPMFVVKSTPPCLTAYCSSQPSLRLKPRSNHHASKIVHQRMARLARLEPKGHAGMGVKFSTSRPTKCYSTALVDLTLQHLSVSAINTAPSFWIRSALDWRYFQQSTGDWGTLWRNLAKSLDLSWYCRAAWNSNLWHQHMVQMLGY